MFVWLREQGFESSVNKVFQKKKLLNSKTIKYIVLYKEVSSAGANLVLEPEIQSTLEGSGLTLKY